MSLLFPLHRKCAIRDSVPMVVALLVTAFCAGAPPEAHGQTRPGLYVQAGPTVVGGIGLQAGLVRSGRMVAREAHLISDLEPLFRNSTEQARVALVVGAALRLTGIERTLGNVPYRGFDLDLGLRAGPALSFSAKDNALARNSRFSLLVEPSLRVTHARPSGSTWYVEFGTIRPAIRLGRWFGGPP